MCCCATSCRFSGANPYPVHVPWMPGLEHCMPDTQTTEESTQNQHWHTLSSNQVLQQLGIAEQGLSSLEAAKRLEQYGPNQLKEAERPGFLVILWNQLNNFVVILLMIASLVSVLLGETIEAVAIMAIVVL